MQLSLGFQKLGFVSPTSLCYLPEFDSCLIAVCGELPLRSIGCLGLTHTGWISSVLEVETPSWENVSVRTGRMSSVSFWQQRQGDAPFPHSHADLPVQIVSVALFSVYVRVRGCGEGFPQHSSPSRHWNTKTKPVWENLVYSKWMDTFVSRKIHHHFLPQSVWSSQQFVENCVTGHVKIVHLLPIKDDSAVHMELGASLWKCVHIVMMSGWWTGHPSKIITSHFLLFHRVWKTGNIIPGKYIVNTATELQSFVLHQRTKSQRASVSFNVA